MQVIFQNWGSTLIGKSNNQKIQKKSKKKNFIKYNA